MAATKLTFEQLLLEIRAVYNRTIPSESYIPPYADRETFIRNINSPDFPFKFDNFALRYTEERGIHLVATEDIPANTVLFSERPAAFAIDRKYTLQFCSECAEPTKGQSLCEKCTEDGFLRMKTALQNVALSRVHPESESCSFRLAVEVRTKRSNIKVVLQNSN